MKNRLFSLITTISMIISLIPIFDITASAATTTSKEMWNGSQNTGNLIPAMNEGDTLTAVGWENVGDQIRLTAYEIDDNSYTNKIGIRARNESHDIGNKDYTGGVFWRVKFSDEDQIKINKGDLKLSAAARYWIQASSTGYLSLRFEFFNEQDTLLDDSNKKTYSNYWVAQHDTWLELNDITIPANTAYVKIWFSNWGSLAGRPFIGDMTATLTDTTAPDLSSTPHLYAVNGSTTIPSYAVPENTVTYAIKFDEAVTVSAYPKIDLSIESDVSYDITYSEDRQTVYFTTALPNTGTNTNVQLKKISGLYVKDDAGNECSYTDESLSVGSLPYKSVFDVTNSLTNLSFAGNTTIRYKRAYSATLTPTDGYKLPDSVTVKVNGSTITDYNYNSSTGQILVNSSAVTGNIEITATAPAQTYTITFDMQGGSGGTGSMDITYLNQLSSVTPPTRNGYTFGGYYTEKTEAEHSITNMMEIQEKYMTKLPI